MLGVAALACLLFGILGCGSPKVRFAEKQRSGPIVVVGDSISAGFELPEGEGYVELLAQRLELPFVNLGVSGSTTEDALPRIAEEVLPLEPSIVIIQLGGNDALRKVEPSVTKSNLEAMIAELHAQQIPILLIGVRGGVVSDKLAEIYRDIASQQQVGLVPDILKGILTDPGLKLDSIHPNAKGHAVVADRVEPHVRRLAKQVGLL